MGGHEGGIFENLVGLLGYDGLCLRLYDQPGLVAAVAERLGDIMVGYYERLLQIDRVIAIFPGDEMAFHTGTFISPEHMRQYVFPWHARFAALAHEAGRPYFLHAYGQLNPLMPDLLDLVGLDARHGFDSEICPASKFKQQWGNRIGILGGVDPDILKGGNETAVRAHVRQVIADCQPGGGFAIGSGSSITDDIPPENYLAMLDEVFHPSA
jgi:uroporphyrinogen decarboxylase